MIIKLNKVTYDLEAKINYILNKIQETSFEQINPLWIANSNPNILVSENRKTARKINRNTIWECILAEPTINPRGRQKFSIRILSITSNQEILVGVALKSTNLYSGAWSQSTAWMFYAKNGVIYYQGSSWAYFNTGRIGSFRAGDIITVQVDMDTKLLSFRVNTITLGPAIRMNIASSDMTNLIPAADFYNVGDSLEFI